MKIKIKYKPESLQKKGIYTIIIGILILKIILHTYWDYNYTYDHNRNIQVTREIRNYQAMTYYGRAYISSPPLYYIINAIIGDTHETLQFLELITYFFASIIVFLITKELSNTKTSLIAYTLMMLTPTSLLIEELDFHAIVLLISGLLILTYNNFLKNPNKKNTIIFGIIIGLAMLTKDSLAIMIILLAAHYLIFERKEIKKILIAIIISIIIYSPWITYLIINNLKMPWQTHEGEITGNLEWTRTSQVMSAYEAYKLLITNWPIMFLTSLMIYKTKNKNSLTKLLTIILLIGPAVVRIILSYFALDHIIFLSITLPITSAIIIQTVNKKIKYLIIIAIIIEFSIGNFNIITNQGSTNLYECEIFDYVKELKNTDMILAYEDVPYSTLNLMSKAKTDYGYDMIFLNTKAKELSATIIMKTTPLNFTSDKTIKCNNLFGKNMTIYIYELNINNPYYPIKEVQVIDENKKPISDAVLEILTNKGIYRFITNNAGISKIQLINQTIKEAIITRNGYELIKTNELNNTITLKKQYFIINYKETRY